MEIRKIIIIEDDKELRVMLRTLFSSHQFEVSVFDSSEAFLFSPDKPGYAAYIIDVNLPGIQGSEIVTAIRSRDVVSPIFIMSGRQDDELKTATLKKGADDYIYKPFVAEHLVIRLQNALERANFLLNARMDTGIKTIPQANTIMVDGKPVPLSDREYKILSHLLAHTEQIIGREELVKSFDDTGITMRTIDVHISSLRKKLEGVDLTIETFRGKGYMARYQHEGNYEVSSHHA